MVRLLKIEWLKYSKNKFIIIFSLIYLFMIGIIYLFSKMEVNNNGRIITPVDIGMFNFPIIWQINTYFIAFLKIFLSIIIIYMITQEFELKIFKQNIIDGLSKKEWLFSKILTIVGVALFASLLLSILSLLLGLIFSTDTQPFYEGLEFLGLYFLKLISVFSFVLLLSILLKKAAIAIIGFGVWYFIEKIAIVIEYYFRNINQKETNAQEVPDKTFITDFLPLESMSNLIKCPVEIPKSFITGRFTLQTEIPYMLIAICIFYFLLFNYLSFYIINKRNY